MIYVSDVYKRYKDTLALDGVSFSILKGEAVAFIGHSGEGKSTSLRVINFLEQPDSGRVVVNGVSIDESKNPQKEIRQVRQDIGMVFQNFCLCANKTVAKNVALPLEFLGKTAAEIDAQVEKALSLVGLSSKRDAYPAALSGGQKQRVAIARAIVNEPKILLADELTSALDPISEQEVFACLSKLKEAGMTIVMTAHKIKMVHHFCDRAFLFHKHKILEELELRQTPQERRFLAHTEFGKYFLAQV